MAKSRAFSPDYLKELVSDPGSSVELKKSVRDILLQPFHLRDIAGSVAEILDNNLLRYDAKLNGLILGYQNTKRLGDKALCHLESSQVLVKIQAEFYVFRPRVGKTYKAVVHKLGVAHVGCLLYDHFNVSLPVDPANSDLLKTLTLQTDVTFIMKECDLTGELPFLRGQLVAVNRSKPAPITEKKSKKLEALSLKASKLFSSTEGKTRQESEVSSTESKKSKKLEALSLKASKLFSSTEGKTRQESEVSSTESKKKKKEDDHSKSQDKEREIEKDPVKKNKKKKSLSLKHLKLAEDGSKKSNEDDGSDHMITPFQRPKNSGQTNPSPKTEKSGQFENIDLKSYRESPYKEIASADSDSESDLTAELLMNLKKSPKVSSQSQGSSQQPDKDSNSQNKKKSKPGAASQPSASLNYLQKFLPQIDSSSEDSDSADDKAPAKKKVSCSSSDSEDDLIKATPSPSSQKSFKSLVKQNSTQKEKVLSPKKTPVSTSHQLEPSPAKKTIPSFASLLPKITQDSTSEESDEEIKKPVQGSSHRTSTSEESDSELEVPSKPQLSLDGEKKNVPLKSVMKGIESSSDESEDNISVKPVQQNKTHSGSDKSKGNAPVEKDQCSSSDESDDAPPVKPALRNDPSSSSEDEYSGSKKPEASSRKSVLIPVEIGKRNSLEESSSESESEQSDKRSVSGKQPQKQGSDSSEESLKEKDKFDRRQSDSSSSDEGKRKKSVSFTSTVKSPALVKKTMSSSDSDSDDRTSHPPSFSQRLFSLPEKSKLDESDVRLSPKYPFLSQSRLYNVVKSPIACSTPTAGSNKPGTKNPLLRIKQPSSVELSKEENSKAKKEAESKVAKRKSEDKVEKNAVKSADSGFEELRKKKKKVKSEISEKIGKKQEKNLSISQPSRALLTMDKIKADEVGKTVTSSDHPEKKKSNTSKVVFPKDIAITKTQNKEETLSDFTKSTKTKKKVESDVVQQLNVHDTINLINAKSPKATASRKETKKDLGPSEAAVEKKAKKRKLSETEEVIAGIMKRVKSGNGEPKKKRLFSGLVENSFNTADMSLGFKETPVTSLKPELRKSKSKGQTAIILKSGSTDKEANSTQENKPMLKSKLFSGQSDSEATLSTSKEGKRKTKNKIVSPFDALPETPTNGSSSADKRNKKKEGRKAQIGEFPRPAISSPLSEILEKKPKKLDEKKKSKTLAHAQASICGDDNKSTHIGVETKSDGSSSKKKSKKKKEDEKKNELKTMRVEEVPVKKQKKKKTSEKDSVNSLALEKISRTEKDVNQSSDIFDLEKMISEVLKEKEHAEEVEKTQKSGKLKKSKKAKLGTVSEEDEVGKTEKKKRKKVKT